MCKNRDPQICNLGAAFRGDLAGAGEPREKGSILLPAEESGQSRKGFGYKIPRRPRLNYNTACLIMGCN